MKKNILISLLLVLFSLNVFSQSIPKKYQSLLWSISGKGLTKPSYLYGTWHVSEKLAFHVSDSFYVALGNVDMIALEADLDSWLQEYIDMEKAEERAEFSLNYYKPSSFYKRAFQVNIPKQKDLEDLLKSSPSLINNMLYRTSSSKNDFEEDTYLDLYIFQAGKKLNKKVIGLEDFKRSRELVNQSETCDDDVADEENRDQQRLKLKELRGDKSYNDFFEDSYRRGDLDLLDSLNKLTQPKACYRKYMLDERNIIMANRMDSLMKHHTLFAGMGAAHLPGNIGVIELLRQKGYTVRPVKYTDGFNNPLQKKLEEIRYPVHFAKHYTSDSAFSVMSPGPLIEMEVGASEKSYLFNDMSNGAYYYVQRINYFGGLTGETSRAILTRLDSIIFESIPGKILSKKSLNKNGFPGYDIVNKTRRGDIQRYQVFITPEELYVFKMSGTGEYVKKGTEADLFFNSISIKANNEKSDKIYSPKRGEYELKVPGNSNIYSSEAPHKFQREVITASGNKEIPYFYFFSTSMYDLNYIEEDTFELNFLAEIFAKQIKFKVADRKVLGEKSPAIFITYVDDSSDTIYSKIIINSKNYYQIGVKTNDRSKAENYLSSFKFLPLKYTEPLKVFRDTVLHFSVKTHVNNSPYSDLVRPNPKKYNNYSKKSKKELKGEKDYLPVRNSRVYLCSETGEKIFVEFRKFSMYYSAANIDSFWNNQISQLSKDQGLILSRKKNAGMNKVSFLLTDTNSTRGLMIQMFQKCGTLYTLKTSVDTTMEPSFFVHEFYESFTPEDTCIGIDVLKDKLTEYFFNKIYSKNEAEQKRAENAIEYVKSNLDKNHQDLLMTTISNPGFSKLKLETKTTLIKSLGSLQSKEVFSFFEKIYERYTDSVSIQLAILSAVAHQKSSAAPKCFLKLLKSELPISDNSEDISYIFDAFEDTLKLAKGLFPELLAFTKYPDYRKPVYRLLYKCSKDGVLQKKNYTGYKNEILNDARYDLKLYMSSTEGGDNSYRSNNYASTRYSGGKEALDILTAEQDKIYWYAYLLCPFYNSDKDVKKFVDKIFRTKKNILKVFVATAMEKNNIRVNDSIWNSLSGDCAIRFSLYQAFDNNNISNKHGLEKCDQKSIVASMLFGDDYDAKLDTLAFLKTINVTTRKNKGAIYIFKMRPKDKKIWKMSYIGVFPENGKINYDPEVYKKNVAYESEKQFQNEIDQMLKKIRIMERKRASLSDFDEKGSSGGYFPFDSSYDDN